MAVDRGVQWEGERERSILAHAFNIENIFFLSWGWTQGHWMLQQLHQSTRQFLYAVYEMSLQCPLWIFFEDNRQIHKLSSITKALLFAKFLSSFSTSSCFGNRRMSSHSASSFFYFVSGRNGSREVEGLGASYVGRICNSFTNLHTKKSFFTIFGAREKDFIEMGGREDARLTMGDSRMYWEREWFVPSSTDEIVLYQTAN